MTQPLAANLSLEDSIQVINANFKFLAQDITDYNLQLSTSTPYVYNITVASGATQQIIFVVDSAFPTAQVGGIIPSFGVYIDDPGLTLSNGIPNPQYLFPDGGSLSSGARKVLYFGNLMRKGINSDDPAYYTSYQRNGQTWYPITDYVVTIRNLDTATHVYGVFPAFKILTAPQPAQFR